MYYIQLKNIVAISALFQPSAHLLKELYELHGLRITRFGFRSLRTVGYGNRITEPSHAGHMPVTCRHSISSSADYMYDLRITRFGIHNLGLLGMVRRS